MPSSDVTKSFTVNNVAGDVGLDEVGDEIKYTITIAVDPDDPDDTYSFDVNVDDDVVGLTRVSGDTDDNDRLDSGEVWVYEGTYTLQQEDLDTNGTFEDSDNEGFEDDPGEINNLVVVDYAGTYTPTGGETRDTTLLGEESAAAFLNIDPAIEIEKDGAWMDGDADGIAEAGEELSYTLTVDNTGNTRLDGVEVSDPAADEGSIQAVDSDEDGVIDGDTNGDGFLDRDETWVYSVKRHPIGTPYRRRKRTPLQSIFRAALTGPEP